MPPASHVAVVGGGAVGCCTALACAARGLRVCLIEPRARLGAEASWAAGGILAPLAPWEEQPWVLDLAGDATERWRQLEQRALAAGAEGMELDRGLVYLGLTGEQRAGLRGRGWRLAPLAESPLASRLHELGVDAATDLNAAVADAGVVRPPAALRGLGRLLELEPQVELWRARVREVREEADGVRVSTDAGERGFQGAVIAAGHGSSAPGLGLEVRPVLGQMAAWKTAAAGPGWVLSDGHSYAIQRRDGLVLVGATLESRGAPGSVTAAGEGELRRVAERLCPVLARRRPDWMWSGVRPGAAQPLIGAVADRRRLWANAGHYRLGICLAPASAEQVAAAVAAALRRGG